MKIGLSRSGYSSARLCERRLSVGDWETAETFWDLITFDDGTLEISFLGLEESALSRDATREPQKIKTDTILYNVISPILDLYCE